MKKIRKITKTEESTDKDTIDILVLNLGKAVGTGIILKTLLDSCIGSNLLYSQGYALC